jgi:acid phosphatase family membrane protein YuiD
LFPFFFTTMDLRRKIERVHHILKTEFPDSVDVKRLRERMGHTPVEIAGGFVVGGVAALIIKLLGY